MCRNFDRGFGIAMTVSVVYSTLHAFALILDVEIGLFGFCRQ